MQGNLIIMKPIKQTVIYDGKAVTTDEWIHNITSCVISLTATLIITKHGFLWSITGVDALLWALSCFFQQIYSRQLVKSHDQQLTDYITAINYYHTNA